MRDPKCPSRRLTGPALVLTTLMAWVALSLIARTLAVNSRPNSSKPNVLATLTAAQTSTQNSKLETRKLGAKLSEAYGKLPLSFEANQGQADPQVKFLSRGSGYHLFLTATEAVLQLPIADLRLPNEENELHNRQSSTDNRQSSVLHVKLLGSNPRAEVMGLDELPGKVNYFLGNDPKKWRTNVLTYGRVEYQGVYPGVDLIYYGNQRQLEYDFVVAPGADPKAITLGFEVTDDSHSRASVNIDDDGELVLRTAVGEMRMHKPIVYQQVDGVRQEIAGRYLVRGRYQVGFQIAQYDESRALVIDPVLTYSTFLGGSGQDQGNGIAVDASGSAYVVGSTRSADFPTNLGAFDTGCGTTPTNCSDGFFEVFVTKLSSDGSAIVYSTYLGGSSSDFGNGIAVDSSGNAYVTGQTNSNNFPLMNSYQTAFSGVTAFVTKLNAAGSALVYSTYFGGDFQNNPFGVAVDGSGQAYITGFTSSAQHFPLINAAQTTFGGGSSDAFLAKFNSAGSGLVYSTLLGGNGEERGLGIAVDTSENAYVTGLTSSSNFPLANAMQPTCGGGICGNSDVFVAKFSPTGTRVYSTYLGGGGTDRGNAIATDASGNAYVTGSTNSTNFPLAPPPPATLQPTCGVGCSDAFVAKLNSIGSLVYSTYLGGNSEDRGNGIAADPSGSAYVTGFTQSSNFPPANPPNALVGTGVGAQDAFVAKLSPTGSTLVFSTFLGGSGSDEGFGIALDASNNAYVTGASTSSNFPTTLGAFDRGCGTDSNCNSGIRSDTFVAKISFALPNSAPTANNQSVSTAEDTNKVISLSASDPDSSSLTFGIVSNPAHGILISIGSPVCTPSGGGSNCTATLTYQPNTNYNGPDSFTFKANDGSSDSSAATISITVNPVNDPPVLSSVPSSASIDELSLYTFTATATDPESPPESLTFSLVGAPPGAAINATSGAFTWTPTEAQGPNAYNFTVRVSDGTLNTDASTSLTVKETNDAPFLSGVPAAASTDELAAYSFTASATDADLPAQTLTFTLIGAPAGATIDSTSGLFAWTASESQGPNSYPFTVRVSDGATNTDQAITLTVKEVNQAPVLASIGNKTIDEGVLLSFTASATDADLPANNLTFSLDSGAPTGAVISSTTGVFNWTPTNNQGGSNYPVTIRVTDNGSTSLSAFETITITVKETNSPPVLQPIGNKMVTEGNALTFTASASDPDLPANSLTYSLAAGAPAGATINPTTGDFNWTPADGSSTSNYAVTVVVTDNGSPSLSDSKSVQIIVLNASPMLSLTSVPASPISESTTVSVAGVVSDPGSLDSQTVTINWGDGSTNSTIPLAPGVSNFGASHQYSDDNPTGTPNDDYSIIVSVIDKDGAVASTPGLPITVNNVAPVITSINGPIGPLALGSQTTLSANFADVGTLDSHTCTFSWDDGSSPTNGAVNESAGTGSCTGTLTYTSAGVYSITLNLSDDDGGTTTSKFEFVVIYDPNGGFVTGGGWINSPAGAYMADPSLAGKANFGFVSKYQKGAKIPTGETEFQFQVASFNFHSSVYEWLVVSGPKAQYKGTGTVNGSGNYGFLLTATDGQLSGGGGVDKFRIKIWDKNNNDAIVYDNVPTAPDDIDTANPLAISGGNIVIHK